jgi:hypothetical protein
VNDVRRSASPPDDGGVRRALPPRAESPRSGQQGDRACPAGAGNLGGIRRRQRRGGCATNTVARHEYARHATPFLRTRFRRRVIVRPDDKRPLYAPWRPLIRLASRHSTVRERRLKPESPRDRHRHLHRLLSEMVDALRFARGHHQCHDSSSTRTNVRQPSGSATRLSDILLQTEKRLRSFD